MANSLGDKIRAARESMGLSQERLAAVAGVSQTTIDKIERGITKRSRLLHYIAVPLGLNVQELDPETYGSPPPTTVKSAVENGSATKKFSADDIIPLYTTDQVDDVEQISSLPEGQPLVEVGFTPLDYVPRPVFLRDSREAYALYVSDNLMEPEFGAGDIIIIDPRLPFIIGTTVVLLPCDQSDVRVIGRLLSATANELEIMQWQRKASLKFSRKQWPRMNRVVAKYYRR